MALSLLSWFGYIAEPKRTKAFSFVQAFSKLSGKFLGELGLCCKPRPEEAFRLVKDLTEQGTKLLPHSIRHSDFLIIWVDDTKLLLRGCASFDVEQAQKITKLSWTKVWLSYDEDDTEALQLLETKYSLDFLPTSFGASCYLTCTSNGKNLCDLRVIEYLYAPAKVHLTNKDDALDDMSVDAPEHLDKLLCFKNLKSLHLYNFCINTLDVKLLVRLKFLYLWKCHTKASSVKYLKAKLPELYVTFNMCAIYQDM